MIAHQVQVVYIQVDSSRFHNEHGAKLSKA